MTEVRVDAAMLNYYKELYNGHKIIYVCFLNEDFIFRTLTRKEYKYIVKGNANKMDLEDAVCNTCCIYPEDYEFEDCGFAGLNEYVTDIILELSGLKDIKYVIEQYEKMKEYTSLEVQCMDLIKAFIPEYTYDEMEEWTWQRLMYTTIRAEKVAELKGFDWHLQSQVDEYMEEINNMTSDNKEFLEELKTNGIDPMYFFAEEIQNTFKREILDFPLIGGIHWNDEEVLNVIRKQIREKNTK